ncbi:hypothetical protein FDP41_005734 [Naegleria fowleri]|uniref:Uncharacterized protein n=1 Tax=Naegleria fowleri TaxID=5763 RepID=A0A6A5BKU0_NAEFO|nr:uncharacterized protein FDP41_005734 [Naegleria fowleri]KAF0974981.1 hypothetical protein FDP41_005734 [Naegleria fowleri]
MFSPNFSKSLSSSKLCVAIGNSQIKVAVANPEKHVSSSITATNEMFLDENTIIQILPLGELVTSPHDENDDDCTSKTKTTSPCSSLNDLSFLLPTRIAFPKRYNRDSEEGFSDVLNSCCFIGNHDECFSSQSSPCLNPHHVIYDIKKLFAISFSNINDSTIITTNQSQDNYFTFKVILPSNSQHIEDHFPSTASTTPNLESPRIQIDSEMSLTPLQVLRCIYSLVRSLIEKYLRQEFAQQQEKFLQNLELQVILSVPNSFTDRARQAWKDSATLSGFNVLRCISSSVSAAVAYGLQKLCSISRILVLDWGSDFKCCDMLLEEQVFENLGYKSYSEFGGEGIVKLLMKKCQERFQQMTNQCGGRKIDEDPRAFLRLRHSCEQAIVELSEMSKFNIYKNRSDKYTIRLKKLIDGFDFEWTLSLNDFESMLTHSGIIDQALFKLQQFMTSQVKFHPQYSQIPFDRVILCGGCMQIPFMKNQILQFLCPATNLTNSSFTTTTTTESLLSNSLIIHDSVHPQQAVVRGAAIQSLLLTISKPLLTHCLISYILPLSIGVEIQNGFMHVVIPRNTWYPCRKELTLNEMLVQEGNVIRIRVFEGERVLCRDNHELGEVELENIPAMVGDKIDVNISIYCNENADLEVTAHALGMKNTVFISQQTNRLTEEEIAEMIELAEKFKVEDYNKN